jgi:murein DD-endopeptidase MepM/ murein hydrolase activator NlpD
MAAAAGTVMGTGDTDLVCKGASYGRWVLIKHDNGLATLSGHLSLIKVVAGQRVERGELIGYAGQTGYATGPHLHFTVAAAQGVEIKNLKSAVCPGTYTMPVFDARAYLDPILYLGA